MKRPLTEEDIMGPGVIIGREGEIVEALRDRLRTRPEAERNQIIEMCANAARNAMILANGKPGTWVLDAIRDLKVSQPQRESE